MLSPENSLKRFKPLAGSRVIKHTEANSQYPVAKNKISRKDAKAERFGGGRNDEFGQEHLLAVVRLLVLDQTSITKDAMNAMLGSTGAAGKLRIGLEGRRLRLTPPR